MMICGLKWCAKLYEIRFDEPAPKKRSVEQLRGIEGSRVRKTYQLLANRYGVTWKGRRYDPKNWNAGDVPNRCICAATSCLYGICEAAILAAGYAPAVGFIHTGKATVPLFMILRIFSSLIKLYPWLLRSLQQILIHLIEKSALPAGMSSVKTKY